MEATALRLEEQRRWRAVVSFVERWGEVAEPTAAGRLAQARAFLELRLMDRAWIRLRELTDLPESTLEAQILTGRMFLERGWQGQAKKALEAALKVAMEDGARADIRRLLTEAQSASPPEPEAPEGDADLPALLRIAEFHLAQGALLKAQRVLERVRRVSPDDSRASDLLWALNGDFSMPEHEWYEWIEFHGQELALPNDLTEESEHTESFQRIDPSTLLDLDDLGAPSFPSLFRSTEAEEDGPTEAGDVTITSAVPALLREKQDDTELTGGDTQIVRVIHNERESVGTRGPLHLPSTPAVPFDLAAFRKEMGIEPQENTPISEFSRINNLVAHAPSPVAMAPQNGFDDQVEEEDDERIVFTRKEPARDEPTEPIEAIEPDVASATPVPRPVIEPSPPVRHRSATEGVAWWLLMLAALGAFSLIGFIFLIAMWLVL